MAAILAVFLFIKRKKRNLEVFVKILHDDFAYIKNSFVVKK